VGRDPTMKVLVCGGRAYRDRVYLYAVLDRLHRVHSFTSMVHGGAGGWHVLRPDASALVGADKLAGEWAKERGLPVTEHPVTQEDWNRDGPSAGPRRNKRMLGESPGLVVAFPGGRGTSNMVIQARSARVPVVLIPPTMKLFERLLETVGGP
jgi:hypothetical protein